jgi:hypothetical protein
MEQTKDYSQEFKEFGIDVQVSAEVANAQWRLFVREYRIVGAKAENLSGIKDAMIPAIMAGDAEIAETDRGVVIKQFVARPQNGGPKVLTYDPPSSIHVARGGTDEVPMVKRWLRVAASLAGKNENELTNWLLGRDYSLMETIAQLFISA